MGGTLVLIESPNKRKHIEEYLGRGFTVKATVGHVCDLPLREYGVDLTSFEETYVPRERRPGDTRTPPIDEIRKVAKGFDEVILATDPDREGEAIAWHVARILGLNPTTTKRAEFKEITKAGIQAGMGKLRTLHVGRVDAQRARRIIDRIIGFDVSGEICQPAGAKSAGRCQTPALHILCERERQIQQFKAVTYWTVGVEYAAGFSAFVPAEPEPEPVVPADGADAAEEADETAAPGRLVPRKFTSKAAADAVVTQAQPHPHVVTDVASRRDEKRPEQPYTTSTVQQDASRKLRISVKNCAALLQTLFEKGKITYHRTDSTRLSDEAVAMIRDYIQATHPEVLPAQPPKQRSKGDAQDAHEAIRPTQLSGSDADGLGGEELALYQMIRARAIACQAKPAVLERTTVTTQAGPVTFVAQGSVLLEKGYLVFWGPYAKQDDEQLPKLAARQTLPVTRYAVDEKKTQPPSRYDQGGLVKKLESSGIGRPSTFANIIAVLLDRQYVQTIKVGKKDDILQPTAFGLQVDELLTASMPALVSEDYTADMEAKLDELEGGQLQRVPFLREWHRDFRATMTAALPGAQAYRDAHGLKAAPRGGGGEPTKTTCDRCGTQTYVKIKRRGDAGSFLKCEGCGMMRDVKVKTKPKGCPTCGSSLIEKSNRDRTFKFMGCVRHGATERPCDYAETLDGKAMGGTSGGGGAWKRTETTKPCPKCKKGKCVTIVPTDPAKGKGFVACSIKECGFTFDIGAARRVQDCPECGRPVIERRRKPTDAQRAAGERGDPFWSCAGYPECKYRADFDPATVKS